MKRRILLIITAVLALLATLTVITVCAAGEDYSWATLEYAYVPLEDGGAVETGRLQDAMTASVSLMNREYYAMRLVIEAKGYGEYPKVLRSVELSEEDRALSAEDKMHLATRINSITSTRKQPI